MRAKLFISRLTMGRIQISWFRRNNKGNLIFVDSSLRVFSCYLRCSSGNFIFLFSLPNNCLRYGIMWRTHVNIGIQTKTYTSNSKCINFLFTFLLSPYIEYVRSPCFSIKLLNLTMQRSMIYTFNYKCNVILYVRCMNVRIAWQPRCAVRQTTDLGDLSSKITTIVTSVSFLSLFRCYYICPGDGWQILHLVYNI